MTNSNRILVAVVTVGLLGLGSYVFSQSNQNNSNSGGSVGARSNNSVMSMSQQNSSMSGMNHNMMSMGMAAMVKDDQSFIEHMLPHHQEAVDSSQLILAKTSDAEIKQFAQGVIDAQNKEIAEMKNWYRSWFGKDYQPTSNYSKMMRNITNLSGKEYDKVYVEDMVKHHQDAIEMAKTIQPITQRQELKTLAANIISTQSSETATLQGWLQNKFNS